MAYFALLWKARTIEKYRSNYEKEKINSIIAANAELPSHTLSQKWTLYRYESQKKISRTFRKWCPEGSKVSNFFVYLKTDQTFSNFLVKSVIGFVGGIVLTYFWFMFFVFQLSISLIHATIMSSIIGVLLTLGLAFSYRIRCLVFLLIPQFFSRVGRYTLTCYALVLILTGPATNTLKNSEVLSESLACGQEQVKSSVRRISGSLDKPLHLMKDTLNSTVKKLKSLAAKMKELLVKTHRLTMSIAHVLQSSLSWLSSVENICNAKLGTPYEHCTKILSQEKKECEKLLHGNRNFDYFLRAVCFNLKPLDSMCVVGDFAKGSIVATVKKKLQTYANRIKSMVSVALRVKHSHACYGNASSASQAAAGIVTEIRHRADPLLTWLSWSSCLTSLFLLLIIFRAKYYQQMFETRSRFDNRYVTKELRDLDLRRLRQGRETVLPLNTRERAKYVSTTSFRLLASERVHLTRSIVFMIITTFKLSIHMVADYSLYWVLKNIRFHGRFQTLLQPGDPTAGIQVSGSGPLAGIVRGLVEALSIPLALPASSPLSCLPNPHPPDFLRYAQIGVLILLLWFFALFEPYGLRLRHVIMGHYQPERARARAVWLYNHIIRTRGCFLKYARRKLHREHKYSTEERLTFRRWLNDVIPCRCLRYLLGIGPEEPHCLLCSTKHLQNDPDTHLKRCETPSCPGVYCARCFMDIGQLCTICLSPKEYGDVSDFSLEKSSSEESDSDDTDDHHKNENLPLLGKSSPENDEHTSFSQAKDTMIHRFDSFSKDKRNDKNQEAMPLLLDETNVNDYNRNIHESPINVRTEESINKLTIPVIVRDTNKELKFVEVPKEKLPGIINTMMLLTTKMKDEKYRKEWNTHDSNMFEYLVMDFFQPVDIFKKALLVRHVKHADGRLNIKKEEGIESLKQVTNFLCTYPMNNEIPNNITDDTVTKDLHVNVKITTPADIPTCDIGNEIVIMNRKERLSYRKINIQSTKRNLKRLLKLKKFVFKGLHRSKKRRSNIKKFNLLRKRRRHFYNQNKYLSIKITQSDTKFNKTGNFVSFRDLAKCRIYEIKKDAFAKNLPIKMKFKRNGEKVEMNKLVYECPTANKIQQLSSQFIVTDFTSDIKPSNDTSPPGAVDERNKLKNNELKGNYFLKTKDCKINEKQCKFKKCGLCLRLWKHLTPQKLTVNSKQNKLLKSENITNHKRRKKLEVSDKTNAINTAKIKAKEDIDDARNYRISLYLKEHEWFKRELSLKTASLKEEICETISFMKKKAAQRKVKEEEKHRKTLEKDLIRQLKQRSKAEEKLKRKLKKEKIKQDNLKHKQNFNVLAIKVEPKRAKEHKAVNKSTTSRPKDKDPSARFADLLSCEEKGFTSKKYSKIGSPQTYKEKRLNLKGNDTASLALPKNNLVDSKFNDEKETHGGIFGESSISAFYQRRQPLLWPYDIPGTTKKRFCDKSFMVKQPRFVEIMNHSTEAEKPRKKKALSLKSAASGAYIRLVDKLSLMNHLSLMIIY